jgi:hypothetical protein
MPLLEKSGIAPLLCHLFQGNGRSVAGKLIFGTDGRIIP